MTTLFRAILLPAAVAAFLLCTSLTESTAHACGPYSMSPAAEVQFAVQAALGDASGYEVESVRFVDASRAIVDVRQTAGWRSGQRTRMIVRLGDQGWAVTARWAIRPSGPRLRTAAAR